MNIGVSLIPLYHRGLNQVKDSEVGAGTVVARICEACSGPEIECLTQLYMRT